MFRPNLLCVTVTKSTTTDIYGQFSDGTITSNVPFAIVQLDQKRVKSSVRTDASASGGNAEETQVGVMLMFPATVTINLEDFVEFAGQRYAITSKHPRYSVPGKLDHFECMARYIGVASAS